MSKRAKILWGFGLAAAAVWLIFVIAASIAVADRGGTTTGTVDPYSNDDALCQSADIHTSGGMGYGIGVLLPGCYAIDFLPSDTAYHNFRLEYRPVTSSSGCWRLYVDGAYSYQSCGAIGTYVRPKVGCAAVHPGEPNIGQLAGCEWGPVTITAGLIPQPTPTPTPYPTVTPRPRAR